MKGRIGRVDDIWKKRDEGNSRKQYEEVKEERIEKLQKLKRQDCHNKRMKGRKYRRKMGWILESRKMTRGLIVY